MAVRQLEESSVLETNELGAAFGLESYFKTTVSFKREEHL